MTSEWTAVPLGQLAARVTTRNAVGNQNVLTISAQRGLVSQQRYFNKQVASENLSQYFLLSRGDFAYNKSYSDGYPVGAIKRLDAHEAGVVSPLYICFRPHRPELAASDYLVHFFEGGQLEPALRAIAKEGARNHGLLNVKASEFFELPVVLPPLCEQRKIAAVLSSVDDAIRATQAVIDQLQVVRTAIMAELLTRGLPGRHTRFKHTEIGEVPEEWEIRQLRACCERITDGTHQSPAFTADGVPFLLVKSISSGSVLWEHTRFVSEETYLALTRNWRPQKGDVLYTAVGTYGVAVAVDFERQFTFQRHIAHIRPSVSHVRSGFLTHFLNSAVGKRQADLAAVGNAQPTVTLKSLGSFLIPLPTLAEQEEVEVAMDAVVEREQTEAAMSAALRTLKIVLMSVLLTCEVRVSGDEEAA